MWILQIQICNTSRIPQYFQIFFPSNNLPNVVLLFDSTVYLNSYTWKSRPVEKVVPLKKSSRWYQEVFVFHRWLNVGSFLLPWKVLEHFLRFSVQLVLRLKAKLKSFLCVGFAIKSGDILFFIFLFWTTFLWSLLYITSIIKMKL